MKQFASLEVARAVKELNEGIVGSKINKIYVDYTDKKKDLFFELHVSNKGKQMMHVILPNMVVLTQTKPEMPTTPGGYCMYLRKYLTNSQIKAVEQVGAERIIKITIDGRDRTKTEPTPVTYYFYFELFSKGNAILTNEQNIILSPLEVQRWSERTVKPRELYVHPQLEYNIYKMHEEDFAKAVELSKKDTMVTMLALDCGLGGMYGEEICARANISPCTSKATKEQAKMIYRAWKTLLIEVLNCQAYVIAGEVVLDIVPCQLQIYTKNKKIEYASFFEAINSISTPQIIKKEAASTKQEKSVNKIKTMIKSQQKQIELCEEVTKKNQRIGEVIYEHFQQIQQILVEINTLHNTHSWSDIKSKYKNNKIVKQINEKNSEVIIDI